MDIRNLLLGKELSVCLFKGYIATFIFISLGVEPNISDCPRRYVSFSLKENPVTLPYKVKLLYNSKDSNLPPNDTTRWQQPSCYFIPFNVLSPTDARNRISALRGPCSSQLNYRTKIINKISKFRAMLKAEPFT